VAAGNLAGLQLIPPQDWSGTLNLTLQATSTEATGRTATKATSFTLTINAVNDAPELTLTAPVHAPAGSHQADAIGLVQAGDVDSSHLAGATVTLSGGQPGDRLDFDGYTLHIEDGRMVIGDTGIEIEGVGHAAGTLTLSGNARPETYAAVLGSLVLESGDASGLAAGSRSISVTLRDSDGATSVPKTVEIVVDEPTPSQTESTGLTADAGSGTTQGLSGSDILLLMTDGAIDPSHGAGGTWTEQIDANDASTTVSHASLDLEQPAADHIQPIDDLQIDTARSHWS
jgi:hypothetical protein